MAIDLVGDTRYGVRMLFKQPGLSIIAIVALALGIGLTTTMFTIVYVAVLRGLPYEEPDRLVAMFRSRPAQDLRFLPLDVHDLEDWREQQTSFEDIAAYYPATVNVSGTEGQPIRYQGAIVNAGLFGLLRVQPILGRTFRPEENAPAAAPVMILSYRAWQNRFQGDPQVIGRVVRANGEMRTIVGVMPERFAFPGLADAWLAMRIDPTTFPRGGGPALEGSQIQALARLKPGVSLQTAQTEMSGIAARLAAAYPESNKGTDVQMMTQLDAFIGPQAKAMLLTMLAAVFGVLLIACANVANLLLARTASRSREIAIRTALGSPRIRIIFQLLTETLLLALAGAALGLVVAKIGIDFFNAAGAAVDTPMWLMARFDPPIIAFVVGLTILSALLAGTMPALRASRADISEILNDESRGSSGLRIGRISRMLVIAEIALSCGLLVAAGRMIKTIVNVTQFEYGFNTSGVLTARLGLFPTDYPTPADRWQFYRGAIDALASLPGVSDVAFSSDLPARGAQMRRLSLDGAAYATEQDHPRARRVVVTPKFFDMFGIRPLKGRLLSDSDVAASLPVVLVNERFVELFLPKGDPVGQRIRLGEDTEPWRTIVGVVPNVHLGGTVGALNPRNEGAYVPLAQNTIDFISLLVRTQQAPATYANAVQAKINTLDPTLPLYLVRPLDDQYYLDTWFYRTFGTLFMAFGVAALALATVGLYGVMSFSVGQRTREIGVRMALGAHPTNVLMLVLKQGAVQVVVGLVLGLGLAALLARGLGFLIFNVRPWDPVIVAGVLATLVLTGTVATIIPARRAARVDPMHALRYE